MGRGTSKAGKVSKLGMNLQFFAGNPKNLSNMSEKELNKSIRSTQKAIKEHEDHIKHPEKKVPDFYSMDIRHQKGLLNFWSKEIKGQKKQEQDFKAELERRRKK